MLQLLVIVLFIKSLMWTKKKKKIEIIRYKFLGFLKNLNVHYWKNFVLITSQSLYIYLTLLCNCKMFALDSNTFLANCADIQILGTDGTNFEPICPGFVILFPLNVIKQLQSLILPQTLKGNSWITHSLYNFFLKFKSTMRYWFATYVMRGTVDIKIIRTVAIILEIFLWFNCQFLPSDAWYK